jgi:hypothetical protein
LPIRCRRSVGIIGLSVPDTDPLHLFFDLPPPDATPRLGRDTRPRARPDFRSRFGSLS